jgi:hypothetical protein
LNYLKRADAAGLCWPLPDDWDNERLERALFAYGQHQQRSPEINSSPFSMPPSI